MKRNQIFLESKSLKQNKRFFKSMFETNDLTDAFKSFDKLDNFLKREVDDEMDLNKFLKLMKPDFFIGIGLQIGSPQEDCIRYWVRGLDKGARAIEKRGIERFAWVICPYNEHNYGIVSDIFNASYQWNLDDIPLPLGLGSYHRKFNLK